MTIGTRRSGIGLGSASDGRDPNDQCEHLVRVEVRLDATGCATHSYCTSFEERP
jgi:hypothetical protein